MCRANVLTQSCAIDCVSDGECISVAILSVRRYSVIGASLKVITNLMQLGINFAILAKNLLRGSIGMSYLKDTSRSLGLIQVIVLNV